ncbi:MAG: hypothetical protein E7240_03160 [Lachnospiraceae bacterium]|nr:hypothetical protein [Lachnospiraceae bacterium]
MNHSDLKKYRTDLFRKAAAHEKVDRVPFFSFAVTWKILDAGYKLSEGLRNYDKMTEAIRMHQEKYNFDAIFELGVRNIVRLVDHLGGGTYIINDEIGAIQYKDNALVEINELDDYLKDPTKFLWERGMAKKYPKWADGTITVADLQKCFDEQKAFLKYFTSIKKILTKEYGLPTFTAQSVPCYPGIDFLFNSILGIKNLSVLMRRAPEKIDEAVAVTNEFFQVPGIAALKKRKGPNPKACFDYDIALLVHTILNRKQFDRWLWPDLKDELDILNDKNMTVRLFMEGSSKPFWDHLQDYRKGIITMHLEKDDPFECRRQLPNCAIAGGMELEMLGRGTPEQCVEHVKALIDGLDAFNGGLILTQEGMVTYKVDAKPENMKAVSDFVLGYRG